MPKQHSSDASKPDHWRSSAKLQSLQAACDGHTYEYHDYFVGYTSIEDHEKKFGDLPREAREAWIAYTKAREALYASFGITDQG